MMKPKIVTRGRKQKYPWDKLQKKEDFFEMPDADEAVANS